ncbi:hypothetical protein NPIL_195811 [Nephila pilipes]|uniref:Uncharacterized protein n=1 Tax=Nephila pilipes TaxID=299642 RepID=A0A8X6NGT9_NEPPI|nr:hypothetical protein NPIL_195811 [Nephila pilipes]
MSLHSVAYNSQKPAMNERANRRNHVPDIDRIDKLQRKIREKSRNSIAVELGDAAFAECNSLKRVYCRLRKAIEVPLGRDKFT